MNSKRNSAARERDRDDRQPDPRTASDDSEQHRRMTESRGFWASQQARKDGDN
ncbi:hypothetical protein [Glycomyces arizonensis]|uniref:hypothetical protein n=1 Tax=Glycomyces arizonensis TaxID=256035 RepID=UPI00041B4C1E|nr:hypothetical protein [Glycomyces arizonensis]